MKTFKSLLPLLLIALAACKSEPQQSSQPAETNPIASRYCLNFTLVDSELSLEPLGNGIFQAELQDHDGGLRSGSMTGQLNGSQMSLNGGVTIEMGEAQVQASIQFDSTYQTFEGTLDVLGPNQQPMISSSLTGRAGACDYDYQASDVPLVAQVPVLDSLHVDLSKIEQISRYRSAAGHNFVDYSGESCVNLKHYFIAQPGIQSLDYFAPAAGTIVSIGQPRSDTDPTDLEVDIKLDADPNIIVRIFHMTLNDGLEVGSHVNSGAHIGYAPAAHLHAGDLAVYVLTNDGYRHISAFEIMTQTVLSNFTARGVDSSDWRNDLLYTTNDPYVVGIYCENQTWGNLRHPNSNAADDIFDLN